MTGYQELITLQFGHFSNHVGTHLWNIQESGFQYDVKADSSCRSDLHPDVMFREGSTKAGAVTFTPRLVAFDLKGSLGGLPQAGRLYDDAHLTGDSSVVNSWDGIVDKHREPESEQNEFLQDLDTETREDESLEAGAHAIGDGKVLHKYSRRKLYNLDESVKVWSDFLRTELHPRSISLVNGYWHGSETEPFDMFGFGEKEVWNKQIADEFEDSLHFFIEECDHMQGFQLLCDADDGFGGLAARAAEYLADEYGSKRILSIPLLNSSLTDSSSMAYRLINLALTSSSLAEHCGFVLPTALSHDVTNCNGRELDLVNYDLNSMFHAGGLLGLSLETLSTMFRTSSERVMPLPDFTTIFSQHSRKFGSVMTSVPLGLPVAMPLADYLVEQGDSLKWSCLSPMLKKEDIATGGYKTSMTVLRGLLKDDVLSTSKRLPSHIRQCSSVEELLNLYLRDCRPASVPFVVSSSSALNVTEPFPHVFDKLLTADGRRSTEHRHHLQGVETLSGMLSVECGKSEQCFPRTLHSLCSSINLRTLPRIHSSGCLEEQQFKDLLENLVQFADEYSDSIS